MKAEDSRQADTDVEGLARYVGRDSSGAETDLMTRLRTKAEWSQESGLMDIVCERGNLMLAYQRVTKNKGAAGVDGIGVAEFKDHLKVTVNQLAFLRTAAENAKPNATVYRRRVPSSVAA